MISKKMEEALNQQINKEIYSAYLYLSMATTSATENLKGFAHWFTVQYHEEMYHAMKIYRYLLSQGSTPKLGAIQEPAAVAAKPTTLFEKALEHEQSITRSIHNLMDLAVTEKDYATQGLLQWYVNEQVEEEENAVEIIAMLKKINEAPQGVIMLDQHLRSRSTSVPTDFSKE